MRDFPRDGLLRLARLFFDTLIWTNPQRTEKLDLRPLMVTSTNSPKWECHYLRGFFQHEFVVASESLKIKSLTSQSKLQNKLQRKMRSKQKSMEKYPKIITFMLEKRFFVTKNCYEKVDDIPINGVLLHGWKKIKKLLPALNEWVSEYPIISSSRGCY